MKDTGFKNSKFNTEDELFNLLRKGPMTVQELSEHLMVSHQYIRQLIEPHYRTSSIDKTHKGRLVYYSLGPGMSRRMPRIKLPDATTGLDKYRDISNLVPLAGQTLGGHKAISTIPYIATKLLMLGLQANTLNQEISPDTEAYAKRSKLIKGSLRAHRASLDNTIKILENNLKTLKNIKDNEELWTLDGLAKHFNYQTNDNGDTIPPVDAAEIINVNNLYEAGDIDAPYEA